MAQALIVTGYGFNCEAETTHALKMAGAEVNQVHINDLLADPAPLGRAKLLVFIGGFSFGDHLGAGRAVAIRFKYGLARELDAYVRDGGLVVGICNGFQVLCKLGLLPGFDPGLAENPLVSLTHNDSHVFRDDWVSLKVNPASPCVFTQGLDHLDFPIRHGEGKFVTMDDAVLDRLRAGNQIVYQYCDATGEPTMDFPANPNGSADAIAGICDATGRIFGTMPHPEAAIYAEQRPDFIRARSLALAPPPADGCAIFANAVKAMA